MTGALRSTMLACALCFAVIAAFGAGSASAAIAPGMERMEIRDIDPNDYPRLTVRAVAHSDTQVSRLTVLQDGKKVEDVRVEALGGHAMSVALVLDASGSMRGEPFARAKEAALAFTQAASSRDRISVIRFSTKAETVSPFTLDRQMSRKAIDALEVGGKTSVYDALGSALEALSIEKSPRKAVIILSDGSDTSSKTSLERTVQTAATSGVPIYAVALRSPDFDTKAAAQIAEASKGSLISKVDPSALSTVFKDLSREFKNEFLLRFNAGTARQSSWLDVSAIADSKKLSASKRFDVPQAAVPAVPVETIEVGLIERIGSVGFMALAGLAVFAGVVMVILSIGLAPKKNVLGSSLEYYYGLRSSSDGRGVGSASGLEGLIAGASRVMARMTEKHGFTEMTAEKLDQTGLPVKPNEFMVIHLAAVVIIGLLAGWLTGALSSAIIAVVFAVLIPLILVQVLIDRRIAKLDEQLPDTLTTLAGLLRAGFGLHQALESTATDTVAPTSTELRNVLNQVAVGITMEDELTKMATRARSKDFDWVVVAISINRETGGNLADILETVADNVRSRQGFKRRVQALAAEGKLSGQILTALPFIVAAGFSVINPVYMSQLFNTTLGMSFLMFGLLMLGVGILWMRALVKIEV